MEQEEAYFVGVDVGTGSVRAALFTENGTLSKLHVEKIEVYNPKQGFYEQSSGGIWEQVCKCVKKVAEDISEKSAIKGIGFDATCSLVVMDENYKTISICCHHKHTDVTKRDVLMWMDHRAEKETEFINSKKFDLLKYVGGKISVEMQMPKILWIKNNLKHVWSSTAHYLCLPDFLTFKATGKTTRSLCSLVCKFNYCIDDGKRSWDDEFLRSIGLENLICEEHKKIGNTILRPGELCGYLSASAASSMGLCISTAVGVSLLDAHAGALGLLSSKIPASISSPDFKGKLGLICGTSTCHLCVSREPVFIDGVWGPFYDAIMPGMWLNEGGQSATGILVDHIIKSDLNNDTVSCDYYQYLDNKLSEMASKKCLGNLSILTEDLHVYPDFHGNRSPLADSSYKGMMCGLTLDSSEETLCLKYLATLQALTYGTKDIVNQMRLCGQDIQILLMCGGLSKSDIFVQLHADILGIPVIIPHNSESVLLGAMMLGACASGHFGERATFSDTANQMGSDVKVIMPSLDTRKFHEKKFAVFKLMQSNWKSYQNIMES